MRDLLFGESARKSLIEACSSMFLPIAFNTARILGQIRPGSFVLVFVLALVIVGCVTEDDLTADQRVYQLSRQLMCPVCDGQTLDQSQAQLSEDMKAVIRTKIEDGETNAEIRAYFVERYGEIVLASPEAEGFNLIAWLVPGLIFVAGAALLGNAFLNMRRRDRRVKGIGPDTNLGTSAPPQDDAELDEYLRRADREMTIALREGSSSSDSQATSEDKG